MNQFLPTAPAERLGEIKPAKTAKLCGEKGYSGRATLPRPRRLELLAFPLLIAVFNIPLIFGSPWISMTFEKQAVLEGQWWRLITHPFVHLTWYHLLLDATAFLTLYKGLLDQSLFRRLAYVGCGAAGSLLLSCVSFTSPTQSLCGLSGIAHGLMAVSALEMAAGKSADTASRRLGWISFVLVVAKAAFEAVTGRMFFSFLNFGLLGDPVAVSHAGGVIGSLTALLCLNRGARLAGEGNCCPNQPVLKDVLPMINTVLRTICLIFFMIAFTSCSTVRIHPHNSEVKIRDTILRHTPLGSSTTSVLTFIDTRLHHKVLRRWKTTRDTKQSATLK